MKRILVIFVLLLFIAVYSRAQMIRLPINFPELLPMEAHWLIAGEGLLSFQYHGNYKFTTLTENDSAFRVVEVRCLLDTIEILEIQNSDTNQLTAFKISEDEMKLAGDLDKKWSNEIIIRKQGNQPSVYYNKECMFLKENNGWVRCSQYEFCEIFGSTELKNSIYYDDILDNTKKRNSFKRKFMRGDKEYFWVIERIGLRGLELTNAQNYTMLQTKDKIIIKDEYVDLEMTLPPIWTNGYESRSKIQLVNKRVVIKEVDNSIMRN